MKHILKLPLLISSFLLIVSLEASIDEKSILSEYKHENYEETIKMSKEFLKTDPEHIKVNLLLGNSAYVLREFHLAMAAYDRVLILEPDNIYTKLQVARIYNLTGNKELLGLELDSLEALNLAQEEQEAVNKLRQSLSSKTLATSTQEDKSFGGILSIGLLYDSNADNDIGGKSFHVPSLDTALRGAKEESDLAHFESVYLYGNIQGEGNLGAKGSITLYNKDYFDKDNSHNDLMYLGLEAGPTFTTNEFVLSLPFKAQKVLLDYKSYMSAVGVGFDVSRVFEWGALSTGVEYKANRYLGDGGKGKDSNEAKFYLGAKKITQEYQLYGSLDYSTIKKRKNLRSDISHDRYGLNVGATKKLLSKLFGRVSFGLHKYKYKDLNRYFLNKRDDTVFRASSGVDYMLNENSSVGLGVDYLNKNSNQALYDYDKFIVSAYWAYRF